MTRHYRWDTTLEERRNADPGIDDPARRAAARDARDIGYHLTHLRKQQGMTRAQAAAAKGISQVRVSHMEHGDLEKMQVQSIAAYVAAIGGHRTATQPEHQPTKPSTHCGSNRAAVPYLIVAGQDPEPGYRTWLSEMLPPGDHHRLARKLTLPPPRPAPPLRTMPRRHRAPPASTCSSTRVTSTLPTSRSSWRPTPASAHPRCHRRRASGPPGNRGTPASQSRRPDQRLPVPDLRPGRQVRQNAARGVRP